MSNPRLGAGRLPAPNKLYFGDNADWLPKIADETVDLIYLDPPFNSEARYHLLYRSPDGSAARAQKKAFDDSWTWDTPADIAFARVMQSRSPAAGILTSLQNFMQKSDLMAYLTMMTARLIELERVLKPTGSLYLHCDSTASHYLKIILDAIFGDGAFRNEIIWKRSHAHSDSKQGSKHFGRITDTILFYAKRESTWNQLYGPYDPQYIDRDYRRLDEEGRRYRIDNLQGPGGAEKGNPYYEVMGVWRHWRYSKERMDELIRQGRIIQTRPGAVPQYKRYLDEMPGVPLQSLWTDLPGLNNRSGEVLNYPTQKPLALLERIIQASSNPGDLVLDPFCGCGTAIEAAQKLGRKWIGIDITVLAVNVVEKRLSRLHLRRNIDYSVEGIPLDMDGAQALWIDSPQVFQDWALTLVDGQPNPKKTGDRGVDGVVYFQDDAKTIGHAVVSVKGGKNIDAGDLRDLIGAMHNQQAKLGMFVTLNPATRGIVDAARKAGSIEAGGKMRPRIQICEIDELLRDIRPNLPPVYDIISSAAKARRIPRAEKPRTPEEIRTSPSFKLPIKGGKLDQIQEVLPMDEPLLSKPPAPSIRRARRRRRRA